MQQLKEEEEEVKEIKKVEKDKTIPVVFVYKRQEERSVDMKHEYIFKEPNQPYPLNKNKNSQEYYEILKEDKKQYSFYIRLVVDLNAEYINASNVNKKSIIKFITNSIKYAKSKFKDKINDNGIVLYLNVSRASCETSSECGKKNLKNNKSYAGTIYSLIKQAKELKDKNIFIAASAGELSPYSGTYSVENKDSLSDFLEISDINITNTEQLEKLLHFLPDNDDMNDKDSFFKGFNEEIDKNINNDEILELYDYLNKKFQQNKGKGIEYFYSKDFKKEINSKYNKSFNLIGYKTKITQKHDNDLDQNRSDSGALNKFGNIMITIYDKQGKRTKYSELLKAINNK